MFRRARLVLVLSALCLGALASQGAEWPQYKGNAARTSIAGEGLQTPLSCRWIYQPRHMPNPAWQEPGKEAHRLDFDFASQPVIAGGRVFFGSSADDSVCALDLGSGRILWRFVTGGPVRLAPAVAGDLVYAGSDDGWAYCLEAATGKVVWKFHAAPDDDLLIGNGRMISRWPLRSGVVVVDGVAYTVAGMWPGEGVYVYALDAATGKVLWRNDSTGTQYVELPHPGSTGFSGVAPQGYLAVSGDVLLVPTGRSCPAAFNRHSGEFLYCWPHRSWNDAKRGGAWLTTGGDLYFNPTREPKGTSESYVGEMSPLPGDGMVAYEVKSNKPVFTLKGKHRIIVNGDTLYAVGNGEAAAYDFGALRANKPAVEARKWSAPHLRVYSMALAGETLFVGGKGVLSAFDVKSGERTWKYTLDLPGGIRGLAIAEGRLVASTDQGVVACFTTQSASPSTITDAADWRIGVSAEARAWARETVSRTGKSEGYALVAGAPDVQLAAALAMESQLHVIHLSRTGEGDAARQALLHTNLYGPQVAVVELSASNHLRLAPYFADLVVVAGDAHGLKGEDVYRVLRPCGGVLVFAENQTPGEVIERIVKESDAPADEVQEEAAGVRVIKRGVLPGAGEWRSQWADGGRSGIGAERRLEMPLGLLWFGGPGPNRMMDRHYGSSPPLSVNGRVFITGEHHVIAYDAYNGRELWAQHLRGAARRGAMWGCANVVADDELVYVAVGAACNRFEQVTGRMLPALTVPDSVAGNPVNWEYIGLSEGLVLGSCRSGSSVIFALDKSDGSLRWMWRGKHTVPPAAIVFGDGRLFCLDLEPLDDAARRRGIVKTPARCLVALDLSSGKEVWRSEGIPKTPLDHLQYAQGVVSVYANAAYDAKDGRKLWQKSVSPARPPLVHGDWIIAQPYAYDLRTGAQRMARDAATGEPVPWEYIQSYGCGGVNGCETMLFFRSGVAGFYDFEHQTTTTFGGIRVGCSTNMIAANGLAIIPETSSGCACTYNFQTCVALAPEAARGSEPWSVVAGRRLAEPFERVHLNLGAPGDRHGPDGAKWLGVPRPILRGAVPVTMSLSSKDAQYFRPPNEEVLAGLDQSWLYGSGVRNPGRISVELIGQRPKIAWPLESLPAIDGVVDESLKSDGGGKPIRVHFANGPKQYADVYLRWAAEALYVGVHCWKGDEGGTWVANQRGEDARVWEDDSWEVYLSDKSLDVRVHLGLSVSGARFDGLWDGHAYDARRGLDRSWNGPWTSAATIDGDRVTLEMAIPAATLAAAGLDTKTLCVNVLGTGPAPLGSPDCLVLDPDYFAARWSGFIQAPESQTPTFTVRADEYALLKVDGKTVVTHQGKGTPGETSGTVALEAGKRHAIEMFYEEKKGDASVQLLWSTPGKERAVVPSSAFFTPDGKANGLLGAYGNRWYEEPVLTRVDPVIDFNWKAVDTAKVHKADLVSKWGPRPLRADVLLPLSVGPVNVEKAYTVRLHFAETEGAKPGQRVFDVRVQDQLALEAFDIAVEAGGASRPVVKSVEHVVPDDSGRIHVELAPHGGEAEAKGAKPVLNGIEILVE